MVFSSVPVYFDQHNWHQLQQPNHQQGNGSENPQLPPPPPPPPQVGGGEGSIRPGSMVDRARLAKLPLPEAGLNCPRCDSTNTKFCYFNNYSLTQPRHFCKTCRRYWTRGGALRSVPVGGGCRRNKRNKSNRSSKSPITSERHMVPTSISPSPSSCSTDMTANFPQLPLMAALQNLNHYGGGNIGGFQPHTVATAGNTDMGFQMSSGNNNMLTADGWRLPFLAGFEPLTNLFPYQNEGIEASSSMVGDGQLRGTRIGSGITQVAPVKVEENRGLNSSRQILGISENNQYWSGNTWTEFSGLNTSTNQFL